MNRKKYQQIRLLVMIFIISIVLVAVIGDNLFLTVIGIGTGVIFLALARCTNEMRADEREITVQEKAARMAYAIFTPSIGIASFLLLLPAKGGFSVLAKGEWLFLEALGLIFAYLSLFLIVVYTISYHFFNRQYGGGSDDKK